MYLALFILFLFLYIIYIIVTKKVSNKLCNKLLIKVLNKKKQLYRDKKSSSRIKHEQLLNPNVMYNFLGISPLTEIKGESIIILYYSKKIPVPSTSIV